ncbi:MAG: hypothetical protein A2741_01305 [Candidatus Zambryskibacteria bacterium RIFCSPHIGHO2_01_FULL_43_27]|uniref:Thioredoxin domain-containing protein n=1 Tax=Candidatus Zambryskibacteria bacterium RIFCSPLOWO2_01_FULL_43_17 TaxID=1802760 RepID=A0A1G2U2L2_9BACT|nr:MAG: hypothetical protein A2741_01305 [Candidatus Zambryskibacteria bacterium RIFCSPHIGHO2_01_FULL_43_27]OHA99915.1 MAG: hypothetical protein A3E93_00215 [Candidatus Zambryskibacteria bacterium RIFCSPHIGHO2_12_FULL_43_12b]OHB03679.1 MAG: hypothetical protein A2920_03160 [Candidatus Zambryskibacteria bacterium RIFCSPLOWO2_01_FULL_43_17]
MKKNIWLIGFFVILAGALVAMWAAGKNTSLPPLAGNAETTATFEILLDDHVLGKSDAKVTIMEYGDFQCPACASYAPFLVGIAQKYPNDVRLVYRHFPLKTIHFRAEAASYVAEAASKQGKFWEMSEKLFENQSDWSTKRDNADFEKYATELGLDLLKFRSDAASTETKDRVERDLKNAISLKLNSTPTIYINGVLYDNSQSGDALLAQVEAEIAK